MIPALIGILGKIGGSAGGSAADSASAHVAGAAKTAAEAKAKAAGFSAAPATGLAKLTSAMKPLADGITKVQNAFAGVTASAGKVASAAGLITEPLKVVVGVMGQFRDSVTALGNQVSQFTTLANPALTNQFKFAADDLTASIGKSLLPVLEFATKYTRMFADAIFTLSGPISNVIESGLGPLGNLIPTITNTLGPVVRQLGNFMNMIAAIARPINVLTTTLVKILALPLEAAFAGIGAVLEALEAPITVIAVLIGELADAFSKFIDRGIADIRKLLGLKTMSGVSTGAAVRNVSISGVEEYQKKAFTQAYALGTASSAADRTAGYAADILAWLKGEGGALLMKLPGEIGRIIMEGIDKITSVGKLLPSPAGGRPSDLSAGESVLIRTPGGEHAVAATRRLNDEIRAGWRRLVGE